MEPLGRIDTVPLFPALHGQLIELLSNLRPEDWQRPTVCRGWKVRDIAAHLLDTDVRRLSFLRDGMDPPPPHAPIQGYRDLVGFLNQLNSDWIRSARRISPRVLVSFLAVTGPQVSEYAASLDPDAPARFAVSWAGESSSANWFDTAREYT